MIILDFKMAADPLVWSLGSGNFWNQRPKIHLWAKFHTFCRIQAIFSHILPTIIRAEDKNILKYNIGEKSLKAPAAIYLDLESLLIKQQSPQNNPEESYTEGKAIHEACGYLIKLVRTYDSDKNAYSFYRGKDCIKKLCKDLRDQEMEIFNYEKKKKWCH